MLDLVERLPAASDFLARSSAERRTIPDDFLSVNSEQGVTMTEAYILRRNIEKFRRMLDEETNQSQRLSDSSENT
jgi:hypothetical protein